MNESTASWAKVVYDMYADGAGDAEVAAHLKLTMKQFHKQMADSASFSTLVEFGRTLSQAWWEGQARKNVKDKQFNTSLWTFYMKNKHGWADKIESSSNNENLNTNLDELRERVSKEFSKFADRYSPELTEAKKVIEGVKVSE